MNIDALGLAAFLAIAEHGRFHKAARELHITQTALTRRLQNFEEQLGVKLVERTTRSVALTQLGRAFLPQARRLLAELSQALIEIRETGKAQRGDVSIACVPAVGVGYLPRILKDYSARYPQNRVRILDDSSEGVRDAVLRREAEFGIHIAGPDDRALESVPLLEDRFVLVCRSDHPLARRKRLTWHQLEGHELILLSDDSGNRPLLDAALAAGRPRLRSHYEVQRSSTAVGLVAAGVGAAIVPGLAIQPGTHPILRVIPLHEPVAVRTLALLTRKGAELSPAAQALLDLIKPQRRRLSGRP